MRAVARFAEAAPLFQVIGNPLYVPWCLEGLAGVAAAKGAWGLAARLSGARDALHASLGLGLPPAAVAANARTVAGSRAALGNDVFTAALEDGQSCSLDRAVAEVMAIVPGETSR